MGRGANARVVASHNVPNEVLGDLEAPARRLTIAFKSGSCDGLGDDETTLGCDRSDGGVAGFVIIPASAAMVSSQHPTHTTRPVVGSTRLRDMPNARPQSGHAVANSVMVCPRRGFQSVPVGTLTIAGHRVVARPRHRPSGASAGPYR